jgi:hypothetical protein
VLGVPARVPSEEYVDYAGWIQRWEEIKAS